MTTPSSDRKSETKKKQELVNEMLIRSVDFNYVVTMIKT